MNRSRIARYITEALALLRQRRFGVLRDKAQRLLSARRSPVTMAELETACASAGPLVCVVDGAQGGGAAAAAAQSAEAWRTRGYGTLCVNCDPLGRLTVSVRSPQQDSGSKTVLTGRLASWPSMPDSVERVEIHSLAGFTQPNQLVGWLQRSICHSASREINAVLYWHDHYLICPTRHLLTPVNDYCGVPDTRECGECLPHNPNCLDAPLRAVDMEAWRAQWGQLLAHVSQICVFSPSSGELIRRCWPDCASKVDLTPHDVSRISLQPVAIAADEPLNIGVIGRIGLHKGADRVRALGSYLMEHDVPARITVIGTLDADVSAKVVSETGMYSPADLAAICRAHGVNVFWLPSIWPETFSFVLHEMRAMGLPILAYDVGAQADTLRREGGECLLPLSASPEDVLAALQDLKEHAA